MQCSVMKPKAVNQPVDERSRERIESVRHQVYLFSFSTYAGAVKIPSNAKFRRRSEIVVYIILYYYYVITTRSAFPSLDKSQCNLFTSCQNRLDDNNGGGKPPKKSFACNNGA